ncbi:hypothetical protein BABINDRAFT_159040 [Babjeviella inositovora NRRL Y-12698]|uniref:ATP-dependent RNA helicase DBP9 n=1 Tax=Babjeviella inositovora NRRL Y-12698 TaxID=984486 RepID=A0A1E3QXQ0_9ASCO|nr:uncharacterized protein BABINDRAFT_159040 [Babjeviella inositovora NRRL Y-12698]ODQ82449.1 hypothetical protein BABINDRAFT_159040 [Babjeviella inositovora NRRL Y-12698]
MANDTSTTAVAESYVDGLTTFESFDLDPRLIQAIKQQGFSNPTLIQAKAIPLALQEKRDIIAKASTGSGKTAAYCIPIIQSILEDLANQSEPEHEIRSIILVPTRELSSQVTQFLEKLLVYCNKAISVANLSATYSPQVLGLILANKPEIVVSTPAKLIAILEANQSVVNLKHVRSMTIDEVDLILSYGYMDDLDKLENFLLVKKNNLQIFLMSATVNDDLNELKAKFCTKPAILKLNDDTARDKKLVQYYVRTSEFDKFLLTYVIFKLSLIKGKTLVFVNNIDRGYRLKLFMEQFGIRCCVLNSELPINSRLHIVEEFNKNVYNLLIATDETNDFTVERDEDDEEMEEAKPEEPKKGAKKDREYGVSRGVDFRNVACVLNFDLPTTSRSYIHRVGRTARAGKSGMALSFVIPGKEFNKHKASALASTKRDEKVLKRVVKSQLKLGFEIKPYSFDMKQVEGFRYRAEDGFRAVTATAIREARIKELKNELLNSEKLKRHFEENPQDLISLRHDKELHPSRVQTHLKRVPDYLLPAGARKDTAHKIGFVPFQKKVAKRKGKKSTRKSDPLKTFKARK